MRVLCAVVAMWFCSVLHEQTVLGQTATAEFERWLSEAPTVDRQILIDHPGHALRVVLTVTESSTRPQAEVKARYAEIRDKVDHPERDALERHLELAGKPRRTTVEFYFAGSDFWRLDRRELDYHLTAAGDESERWYLSCSFEPGVQEPTGGQLTLLREGVPFPAGFNGGQFIYIVEEYLSYIFSAGLRVDHDATNYTVRAAGVSVQATTPNAEIFARRLGENQFVIDRMFYPESGASREFEEFKLREDLNRWLPTKARITDRDKFEKVFEFTTVELVPREAVAAKLRAPEPPPAVKVMDFREPDSPASKRYTSSSRLTYTLTPMGETVVATDEEGVERVMNRPTPLPPSMKPVSLDAGAPAPAVPPAAVSGGVGWSVVIAAAGGALVCAVLAWMWMQRRA